MSEPTPPGEWPDPTQQPYYGQYEQPEQYPQHRSYGEPVQSGYPTYQGPPPTATSAYGSAQPGAAQPGYQPYAYPSAYPSAYPPAGYAYPYSNAYATTSGGRPGTVTASAVLGYVTAGLIIVAGIVLFSGASAVNDLNDVGYPGDSYTAEFITLGMFNLIAAGLLIGGSVSMTGGSTVGRTVHSVGSAIVLVLSVYWLVRWASKPGLEPLIFYALLFGALVVVAMPLAWNSTAGRWFLSRNGQAQPHR